MQPRSRANSLLNAIPIAILLSLTFLFGCFKQRDADIWWHLKTGQLILERGELPDKDWYTFTSIDRDWIDLHWLFQIAAARIYATGGMELLTVSSAALGTIALGIQLLARRAGWSVPVTIASWYPFLFLLAGRLYVRPEVVTLVCLSCFLAIFFHADRQPRWLYALVPLQILWVNVQGLFILGLLLTGIYWVDGAWRRLRRLPGDRLQARTLLLFALTGVCLLNPYGFRGLVFPFELFRKMTWDAHAKFYSEHIGELQSVFQFIEQSGYRQFYILIQFFLLLFAATSFLLVWSSGRFDLFRLLAFGLFAWLGIQATRNSGQFALVVGAVTAWNFGEWYAAWRERRVVQPSDPAQWQKLDDRSCDTDGLEKLSHILPVVAPIALSVLLCATIVGVASGSFYEFAGEGRLFGLGEHPFWHAHRAAHFAAQPGMPQRMLAFHLGHAAVFEFHKREDQRTFCDPRLEVVSREVLEEYHAIEDAIRANRPEWPGLLSRHDLRMLLIDHRGDHGLEATLLANRHWRCVYFDAVAAVYLRLEDAEQLQANAVDFAARCFRKAQLAPDHRPATVLEHDRLPPKRGTGLARETNEDLVQAEAFFNIARGMRERPATSATLLRSMALLALDHARSGAAEYPDSITGWRLMGLSVLMLAGNEISVTDEIGTTETDWDPVSMLDIARARLYLTEALARAGADFPTLTALFGIAAIQKDRKAQHEYALQLLSLRPRTRQEGMLRETVRKELSKLGQRIDLESGNAELDRVLPENSDQLFSRIVHHLSGGRMDFAISEFARFVAEHGTLPWPLVDCYAGLLMRSGRPDLARKIWVELPGGDIDEGHRDERVASTYLALGNYQEAIEMYRRSLNLSPTFEAHWGLARCYLETGNREGLSEQYVAATAQHDSHPRLPAAFQWMGELITQSSEN